MNIWQTLFAVGFISGSILLTGEMVTDSLDSVCPTLEETGTITTGREI